MECSDFAETPCIDIWNINNSDHECIKFIFQIVDKLDLFGLEFMWQIALETPNEDIAGAAVKQLMRVSYGNLSQRLKKVRHRYEFIQLKEVESRYLVSFGRVCNADLKKKSCFALSTISLRPKKVVIIIIVWLFLTNWF